MGAGSGTGPNYEHRRRRHPRRPHSALAERWALVDGVDVFYRESPTPPAGRVMMHVHGFGLSGRYLLPTAERLADEFHTLVPDLPGFGRSGRATGGLDVPDLAHAAARFLDDRGIERVTLVGNSMGCPVICEFAHHYPDRLERAVIVSPAGQDRVKVGPRTSSRSGPLRVRSLLPADKSKPTDPVDSRMPRPAAAGMWLYEGPQGSTLVPRSHPLDGIANN